jgi:hypothetical protein
MTSKLTEVLILSSSFKTFLKDAITYFGARGGAVVEALCYNLEGRGIDF